MLDEAISLPEAAGDTLDALLHLSLLAAVSGFPAFSRAARLAALALLTAPDAGRIVPAEYLALGPAN